MFSVNTVVSNRSIYLQTDGGKDKEKEGNVFDEEEEGEGTPIETDPDFDMGTLDEDDARDPIQQKKNLP